MKLSDWTAAHPAPPAQARPKGVEISYSQIRSYLDCPWAYHLRWQSRWRSAPTPASAMGQTIHRALELFHGGGGTLSEARLLELYEDSWVNPPDVPAPEVLKLHAKGVSILKRYWAEEKDSKSSIEFVEKEFMAPLGPHTVRGIVDRVDRRPDGSIEVVDYKTHQEVGSEADAAADLQLRLYGWGVKATWALEPKWLTWRYVAAGKSVTVPYDPSGEDELEEFVLRVADILAAGRAFTPDLSFCPRCDFRLRCDKSPDFKPK